MAQGVSLAGNPKLTCPASVTVTITPAALPSNVCDAFTVQNDPASAVNILVGDATRQTFALKPGDSFNFQLSNTNLVTVATASGTATLNYLFTKATN